MKKICKYVLYSLFLLICLFIVVFFINLLIVTQAPFKVAQDNDWIGFWGSVLGAILSGIITFIVLKITIYNEDKKRKKDVDMIKLQRLEDKRMSILPYLHYTIIDDEYIQEKKIKKKLITPGTLTASSKRIDNKMKLETCSSGPFKAISKIEYKADIYTFNLLVENLGLGVVIEPRITKIFYDGYDVINLEKDMNVLNIGEGAVMKFTVVPPDKGFCPITITIGYFNLIRDYYEQKIVINFKPTYIGKTAYEPVISSIHKPQIYEERSQVISLGMVNE